MTGAKDYFKDLHDRSLKLKNRSVGTSNNFYKTCYLINKEFNLSKEEYTILRGK